MRVTYVNVRARHLLKKSMVRALKNMAAIVTAIVMNLPGMTLQPLYKHAAFCLKTVYKTFPLAGQNVSLSWNGTQLVNNSMVSNQQLYTSNYWINSYTPIRCELTVKGNASARQ